jgi:hypothetical protein
MRGIFNTSSLRSLALLLLVAIPAHAGSENAPGGVKKSIKAADAVKNAVKLLEQGVEKLGKMTETKSPFNKGAAKGGTNTSDKNSSESPITDHAWTESTCKEWDENHIECKAYDAAFITTHKGDASASENFTSGNHQGKVGGKGPRELKGQKVTLGALELTTKDGGDALDDGKLDKSNIADATLAKDTREGIEKIAVKTSDMIMDRNIEKDSGSTSSGSPQGNVKWTASSPEGKRYLAVMATQEMDRHLLFKAYAAAAGKKGIEVLQGDGMENPDKYAQQVNADSKDDKSGDEKLKFQAPLDPDTTDTLEERVKKAEEIRNRNPFQGGGEGEEGKNFDEGLYAANLYALRKAGASAGELSGIAGTKIDENRVKVEVTETNADDRGFKKQMETNADTLKEYNQMNDRAFTSMQAIQAKVGNIKTWDKVAPINPGEMSIADINGYTPDQIKRAQEAGVQPTGVAGPQFNTVAEMDDASKSGNPGGTSGSSRLITTPSN